MNFTPIERQGREGTRHQSFRRGVLSLTTLALSWYAMLLCHELGHVLHAWASGGVVEAVRVPLLGFSQTVLSDNPRPLFVAWGGPIWGSLLPLAMALVVRRLRWPLWYVLAFMAGFCLVANGAYLTGGVIVPAGDVADLLRHGVPRWLMLVLGLAAVVTGLAFWHGLGRHLGLGSGQRVPLHAPVATLAALAGMLVLIGWLWPWA